MKENINILRLACLLQDRDNQDFKRVVLSIIFEILYENNNENLKADELFNATITKSKESIERDFFDNLITNSHSFDITNTESEPLIKLTPKKFDEVEKNISEFSIEPSIEKFLKFHNYDLIFKDIILKILYQSIYENIYAFNPLNLESLVPDIIKNNFTQQELNIFNEFLEFDDPIKNRRLYNQFVKAIEFAILTSGKGVKQFSENIYNDKTYVLDTNIIFRMLGVGGEERMETILKLIKSCIKQGVIFEYSLRTFQELNNTLDSSINKISKAEQAKNIEIIQELVAEAPHFFNDDFIVQYSRLKNLKFVNSPEQYGLLMKSRFKKICSDLNIEQANHNIKLEPYEIVLYAKKLIQERKKITTYRYSNKQAEVDAYNVLYVNKRRGNNNFNYSEVKSFYLTTDRGLNKILSDDKNILIPATILPSQLFAIHNPLSNDSDDIDYDNFFSFIKRRTSEFKHRGRDIFSFINQARVYSTDKEEIKNMIVTFTDERYSHAKIESVQENVIIKFKDFAKTYFDTRLNEIDEIEGKYKEIEQKGRLDLYSILQKTKNLTKRIDLLVSVIVIPLISLGIGMISRWYISIICFLILEYVKFYLSKKENYNLMIWKSLFIRRMKETAYYKLTSDDKYIDKGIELINYAKGNVWENQINYNENKKI
ncbi:hypothetical protein [Flavobacterium muglaense]|uniref:PIN domain-containing protein n=1 Tax=Flavobacterium muglaense TaxID=2764716 RepID=A0A923MZW9_9FLAO|nr:hypothetical protein [Flavobacterium muglaense]MBC5837588.1 hypothetical protein [Flavobacterium muglaense]MBC5844114.1 hypothetical protein [Flavobacterium muglaense]